MDFIARLFGLRHAKGAEFKETKIPPSQKSAEIRHVPAPPEIKVKDVKEDVPEFKKIYSGVLSKNARIELDAKYCDIYKRRAWGLGTLTQPNGNYVFFDVDRIADKILDPQLVPLINDFVKAAKALDAEYARTDQTSFIDKHGKVWLLEGALYEAPKPKKDIKVTDRENWLKHYR